MRSEFAMDSVEEAIAQIIAVVLVLAGSFLGTAGILWLICWCFGWGWSWQLSLGTWLILFVAKQFFLGEGGRDA